MFFTTREDAGRLQGEGEDSPETEKIVENGGIFQSCINWQRSWKIGEKMSKKSISIEIFECIF